ncbi:hypothetical protein [Streptococcus sp. HMSC061D10]|uniref:hypothetical protein n=1 Tax=Streptococcus sp. HMSC061D10 TaxID=1715207 RepID=UPI0008CF78C1|nr:hypothetical protein [Streptococcus sp. HMSC061D10]OFN80651.1 hypothetical protein HMPREF2728_08260 [Streptococcus sp. HMSC061D10]
MIKRVFCLILFFTFVMIPTSIGATSHPLPSGRLTGEELAMEYAQEGQISVERAKIILSIDFSDSQSRTYRILSKKIIVNPNYEARVKFYCRTDESGQFRGITKLLAASLVNKDGDKEAPFTGNLFAYLEDPNRLFYMISGEFYHKGSNQEQLYQREGGRMLEVIYDFVDDTSTGFPVFLETKLRF